MNVLNRLAKFARKAYRDGFLRTQVRGGIAYQIQALRKKLGLSQTAFAELTGKKQSVISRLENTDSGLVSVQTLLDIASGLNVALLVRFVSYPEFLRYAANMSSEALQPETIFESLRAPHEPKADYSKAPLPRMQQQLPDLKLSDLFRTKRPSGIAIMNPPPGQRPQSQIDNPNRLLH